MPGRRFAAALHERVAIGCHKNAGGRLLEFNPDDRGMRIGSNRLLLMASQRSHDRQDGDDGDSSDAKSYGIHAD